MVFTCDRRESIETCQPFVFPHVSKINNTAFPTGHLLCEALICLFFELLGDFKS